jgi:hypothetical protein
MLRKKQIMMAVALTVILSIVGVTAALAQDSIDNIPGGGWWTGTQIQNVGTDTATITIASYHKDDQSKDATKSDTIAKDASKTFLPNDLNLGAGEFQGSATVSSNQPLRAIVNTTNLQSSGFGVPGGTAAAQYQGVNTPATELNFPLAKNNHADKTTTFYIQNAGSTAATATAEFKFAGGNCTITTPTIQPSRMVVVSPATQPSCGKGTTTGLGSLKVTSSQPMAGVVLEHKTVENPATILQATRGFAPTDADTKVFAPIIKSHWFNRYTGLQIQNASGGSINVTVTYKGAAGDCAGQTRTSQRNNLPAGESVTFVHIVGGTYGNPMPANCLAAASVEATGNVVAIVNESWLPDFIAGGGNGGRQESTTYSAFPAKTGTQKVSAPLFKEDFYDKTTGIQVQNISDSSANVVLRFVGPNATYTTKPQVIGGGESKTFLEVRKETGLWDGTPMPPGTGDATGLFGVIITANQNIVAVANESTYPFNNSPKLQDKNNYEGFNLTP